jgi:hypothetical protein
MTPERAELLLADMKQVAPGAGAVALAAAAQAFRLRPQFLRGQPRKRQAEWMRKALCRPTAAPVAEEVLAEYFLAGRKPLLVELLDALGIPHDDGALREASPPCPPAATLEPAVAKFRAGAEPELRELLLAAFAAQSAIDWPALDVLVAGVLGITFP